MRWRQLLCLAGIWGVLAGCGRKETDVYTIETNIGEIKLKLYDETPLHRDNFRKLVKDGYYEGMLFHRVIRGFVVQTGDPDSRQARPSMILGANEIGYKLPAEIRPEFFHRRGVIAAARESDNVNPDRQSSGSHFYIVQGIVYTPATLDSMVEQMNDRRYQALFERLKQQWEGEIQEYTSKGDFNRLIEISEQLTKETQEQFKKEKLVLTEEQKKVYTTVGGIPSLDGAYTIFGEVTEGMEIVDKITALKTDINNRPLEDVRILKIK